MDYVYKVQKELSLLGSAAALLGWDQQTHMPSKGVYSRAETVQYLSGRMHELLASHSLWSALNRARRARLSGKDSHVVRVLHKDVQKIRKVPTEFVRNMSKEAALGHNTWEQARDRNSFHLFQPSLKKLVSLARRHARYLNPQAKPYDALINEFEEGMSTRKYTPVFIYLQKELVRIMEDIKSTAAYRRQRQLKLKVPVARQREVSQHIASLMQVTPDRAALDVSAHPFSIPIGQDDVRITTRFTDALESLGSTVHESGHALYELGLPARFQYTVLHDAPSYGMHESQSRFWELMVAKSAPFWKGYSRHFNRLTGLKKRWQQYYSGINQVRPSFVRVESDEVTYNLHIILRFEIERDLMNGRLSVRELPQAWNSRFHELMGLKVRNDNQGCLQDVHWSGGAFGYFPSYAVGTIYASQLMARLQRDMPSLESNMQGLKFKPIIDWLGRKVHSRGRTMLADDIVKKVCGDSLNPKVFVSYLREKYGELYGF
jgi:carboxypeptidase Taq